jgi:hypothetical protein
MADDFGNVETDGGYYDGDLHLIDPIDEGGPGPINFGEGGGLFGIGEGIGPTGDPNARIKFEDPVTIYLPSGDAYRDTYLKWIDIGLLPGGLTWGEFYDPNGPRWGVELDRLMSGSASRGGGRGSAGAVYERPDERLVRDAIKGVMSDLVGRPQNAKIDGYVDQFMTAHKANFNNKGQQIDPMAGIVEDIRNSGEYKTIHAGRDEGVDEASWVSSRVGLLINAGVSQALAVDLGIEQATAAATPDTVVAAGQARQFSASGRMLDSHKAKMRETMFAGLSIA